VISARRQKLLDQLGNAVLLLPQAGEVRRNRDTHFPFRFDSYFQYLTGFPEPDAVLVLVGGGVPQSLLFCRDKDPERETWDGFRYGPEAAAGQFGFDVGQSLAALDVEMPKLLANRTALYTVLGEDAAWDQRVMQWLNSVRSEARNGVNAPDQLIDCRALLDAMRLVKDADERALLRQAADLSAAAHRRAMQCCRPGMYEYEIEAEFWHEFRRHNAVHSYPPIVAGGANACVLHYVGNDQPLRAGDLLLIDAGCELAGYAGDITRTFPVNGRFSGPQRDLYELVLAAQAAAFAEIRPGVPFIAYHQAAVRAITQGLVDLGLLTGAVDGLIETEAYKPFYMHKSGHWLGLDVHDAGRYRDGELWTPLAEGMVLTVEPGCYVRPAEGVPEVFWNIGIRIEDDVCVTAKGMENMTAAAPKTVVEIEEAMRHD
jgi:Xaa-Pro aminopeptidase